MRVDDQQEGHTDGQTDGLFVGKLRSDSLSFAETLGQSIANIAPTLTPALNIAVVVAIAGTGAWISYAIATIGSIFVAANISVLARRHSVAGSYFLYIGRVLGPLAGMLAGWSMVAAYLFTAIAAAVSADIFLSALLHSLQLEKLTPPYAIVEIGFISLVWFCAYDDVRFSSRAGLVLEAIALMTMIVITVVTVIRHGSWFSPSQLYLQRSLIDHVAPALTLAFFSFVGFESSATLAKEARDPIRIIPRTLIISAAISGLFFVSMAYFMILAVNDQTSLIGGSASPFAVVTQYAGLSSASTVVYFSAIVSTFACALACINALARMLFSMGRYQFAPRAMGRVHDRHQSPHIAASAGCVLSLIVVLTFSREPPLDIFGCAATLGTFGFLTVYLLTCIVAPVELFREGTLSAAGLFTGATGIAVIGFVLIGSAVPAPPYPYGLLPYIFVGYLAIACVSYGFVAVKYPLALQGIEQDLEG
jgi:amino acid transporter